jgi:hypothetical protein
MTVPTAAEPRYTQARIRVRREGALKLRILLSDEETALALARREAIRYHQLDTQRQLDWDLENVRRMVDEVERTIEEQGWDEPD